MSDSHNSSESTSLWTTNILEIAQNVTEANMLYKKSQVASGVSRVLKRSYLEKAIRMYGQELRNVSTEETRATLFRNIGMSNFRLAEVVDSKDAMVELDLVSYHLKEAVTSFTKALECRPNDMTTQWGISVEERIMDSFDLGFRRTANRDVENERMRSSKLDKLLTGIPGDKVFDALRAKCYLAKAQYFHRRTVVAQELCNFQTAIQFLEYSNEEFQLAKRYGVGKKSVEREMGVIEEEISACRSTCESLRSRHQADHLLESHLRDEEGVNMGMMWAVLDKYKEAVLLTREMDIENEAVALSRMGRMFDKILKMRVKAHQCYRGAFDLAQTLLPRELNNLPWFQETQEALKRFQRNVVLEEQKREEEEKAPILKKLEPELKILKEKAAGHVYDAPTFLKFLYKTHPPKIPYKFDAAALNATNSRTALKEAITHYHPDRQAKFGVEWKVLCGEITKYLTTRYENYK